MTNCTFILILPSTFRWRRNSFPVKSPRDWSIRWTPVHPPGNKSGRCNHFADSDSKWESWPFSLLLWYVMRTQRLRDCGSCKILLPRFLFLTAVWKVLPLSHSIFLVHGFFEGKENSLLHPWTTVHSLWKLSFPLLTVELSPVRAN